jgi:hypothetical protein
MRTLGSNIVGFAEGFYHNYYEFPISADAIGIGASALIFAVIILIAVLILYCRCKYSLARTCTRMA